MSNLKEYQAEAHKSVDNLFQKIEDLKKKADQADAERKKKIQERIDKLNQKKEKVQKRYDELSKASEDSWKEVKRGFEHARDDLRSAWEKARAEFK